MPSNTPTLDSGLPAFHLSLSTLHLSRPSHIFFQCWVLWEDIPVCSNVPDEAQTGGNAKRSKISPLRPISHRNTLQACVPLKIKYEKGQLNHLCVYSENQ